MGYIWAQYRTNIAIIEQLPMKLEYNPIEYTLDLNGNRKKYHSYRNVDITL